MSPSANVGEETSRYGLAFWAGLAIGWAAIAFGLWSLVQRAGATRPIVFAGWFLGLLVLHDLVVVPIVLALGVVLRGRVPPRMRGAISGAIAATGILVVVSVPALAGFGIQPDNPSLLPRNYPFGLAAVLVVVWVATTVVAIRAIRGSRSASHREARPQPDDAAAPGRPKG